MPTSPPRKQPTTLEALVAGLAVRVDRMNEWLGVIVGQLDTKPSRVESAYRRRLVVLMLFAVVVGSMFLVDQHTEVCGPGHRAEVLIDALSHGQVHSNADFQRIANHAKPSWVCGLTFPLHTHDRHSWPEPQHVAGMLMYGTGFALLGGWTYLARRRLNQESPMDFPDHRSTTDDPDA